MAGQVSDYERKRLDNLADNKVMLSKLMEDLKKTLPGPLTPSVSKHAKKSSRRSLDNLVARRNPSRSARYNPFDYTPPVTRARRGSVSSSTCSTPTVSTPEKMVVRFGNFLKAKKPRDFDEESDSIDIFDDEEESLQEDQGFERLPAPRRQPRVYRDVKSVEDITEDDLAAVAQHVSEKRYDSHEGSTCHQCRQKTDDFKTICRSPACTGVRGQFCGPCLRNRYGEDARKSLKDQAWICPPCRGICNCSFCRKKAGRCATGILIHLARENGYTDVNDYLQSFKK